MAKDKKQTLPDYESEAFDLLREVVTLGRNNKPYREPLNKLHSILDKAPGVRRAIGSRVANIEKDLST